MFARTRHEAVRSFLEPLKAVIGCVTSEGLVTRDTSIPGEQQTALLQDGFVILSRRNGQALSLELNHRFVVRQASDPRGRWMASTTEYIYKVFDEQSHLIAAWHWHPGAVGVEDESHWPHVHAYGARDTLTLHRLHLPTGRVALEAVVRFLIEDLGVVPRRADWRVFLDRHETRFRQTRTWA